MFRQLVLLVSLFLVVVVVVLLLLLLVVTITLFVRFPALSSYALTCALHNDIVILHHF